MEMVTSVLGFGEAAKRLSKRRVPKTAWVLDYLEILGMLLKLARCLFAVDPERLRQALNGRSLLDPDRDGLLAQSLYAAIHAIAPVDLDAVYNNDAFYLFPDPLGFQVGWDDWDNIRRDMENYYDWQLYILLAALRLGDREALQTGIQLFGWEIELPAEGALAGNLNWQQMEARLDEADLSCFKAAWDIACYQTGNIYYDYNAFDEGMWDVPPFDEEGVRYLASEWQAAQPFRAQWQECERRILQQPEVLGEVARIFLECMTPHEKSFRPMTLAEMWADESNSSVIDPFYGPIGVNPDADDGIEQDEDDTEELEE